MERGQVVKIVRAVEQSIESFQVMGNGAGQCFQAAVVSGRKVVGKHGRFGAACGKNFVVYRFKSGLVARKQGNRGTVPRKRQAGGASESRTGTRDENDATCKQVRAGKIVFHSCSSNAPADCTPLRVALSSVAG